MVTFFTNTCLIKNKKINYLKSFIIGNFFVLLFLFPRLSFSQELTNLSLSVANYHDQSNELLFKQLQFAKRDTLKVKLLLRICSFYFRKQKQLDSTVYYAKQAKILSQDIKFNAGYYESCFLLCKVLAKKGNVDEAKAYIPLVSRSQQTRLLLVLGEHYLFLPNQVRKNLDSSYIYLKSALLLSEAIQSQYWKQESLVALGKYYFSAGEFKNGKESFLKIIQYHQQTGNKSEEARLWYELAAYMPDTDSTFHDQVTSYQNALRMYYNLKDYKNQAEVLYDFAAVQRFHFKYDTAINLLLQGIDILKSAGIKKKHKFYYELSTLNQIKGNLDAALNCSFQALKSMEIIGDTSQIDEVYYTLAQIYGSLDEPAKSLGYYMTVIANDNMNSGIIFYLYSNAAEQLIKIQKPREALKLVLDFEKRNPAVHAGDKETIFGIKGDCHHALHNDVLAERYYLKMIEADEITQLNKSTEIITFQSISGSTAYYKIGKFYVDKQKYRVASPYILKSFKRASFESNMSYSVNLLRNILLMQFKIDSATGNYFSAIQKFQSYTAINDSIFNARRINEVEKLRLGFETAQKEKDIQLLQKESQLQQKQLTQSNQFKRFSVILISLLFLLMGLIYNRSRLKQKNNVVLEAKQAEISKNNVLLQHMVDEKEWLLKEIHHRVKNNLQVVMSLLNSQATLLQDKAALSAIQESQHRVQTMALIHQKLYLSESLARIPMSAYIQEVAAYLYESYKMPQSVRLNLLVEPIELDVTLAVPLGLIINEAITNAFKYAFPEGRPGSVTIDLHELNKQTYQLTISDDGIGLPVNHVSSLGRSLGMTLIRGFSEQLGGELTITGSRGVTISLVFIEEQISLMHTSNHYAY